MLTLCPLCMTSHDNRIVSGADHRTYYLCSQCSLIFADSCHLLPPEEEKQHYATHENHIDNAGYVSFLNQLLEPLLPYLRSDMRGLDYGSGPGPTLSQLVKHHGMDCDDYDPFFTNTPLNPPYDFILATECFEHFHRPADEMKRITEWLKSGGLLGVMTEHWTTLEQFHHWYYTKDPTHVCFYHANTLDYLCRQYGFVPLWQDTKRVTIFRRHP